MINDKVKDVDYQKNLQVKTCTNEQYKWLAIYVRFIVLCVLPTIEAASIEWLPSCLYLLQHVSYTQFNGNWWAGARPRRILLM